MNFSINSCQSSFSISKQGYRTPPEDLGPYQMSHPQQQHQMPFQGIPQLPQYDPKLLHNAPKELMRGISYPAHDEDPYLQGDFIKEILLNKYSFHDKNHRDIETNVIKR